MLTTIGYAMGDGSTVVGEAVTLLTTYPYVLMATVSAGLFALVIGTSIRVARDRISHETWYGLHLYAYLAVALGFAAFAMGRDGIAWLAERSGYEGLAITDDDRLVGTPGMDALLA